MPKPGNPGHTCCHITIRILARIHWVKTVPSRIRAASSNPAHAQHKRSCGHPVPRIHARCHDHTRATRFGRSRGSGWRGNRRSYDASPTNRGAGESSSSPHHSRPLASSHEATAAAPFRKHQSPERRLAGAEAGTAPSPALGNRIASFIDKFTGEFPLSAMNTRPRRRAMDASGACF